MTAESVPTTLNEILGAAPAGPPEGYRVHGPHPTWAAAPTTAEQAAAVLALAAAEGLAVIPRGRGSRDALGAPLQRADLVLQTHRLNQVVEYNPADLTVTIQAGMPMADLQGLLARAGQFLPLDPPGWQQATVGGLVAVGAAGPLRLGYGAPRDMALGLEVALPAGHAIRTGGRVVKNVAGYDMTKLFTGSLGTLGVVTEVTLKVRPLPAAARTLVAGFPTVEAAAAAARSVLTAGLEPVALEILLPATGRRLGVPGPYGLAVTLAGSRGAVAHGTDRFGQLVREAGSTATEERPEEGAPSFWSALLTPEEHRLCTVQAAVPPARTRHALIWAETAAAQAPTLTLFGHGSPGTGVMRLQLAWNQVEAATAEPEAVQLLRGLRRQLNGWGGHLTLEAAPPALKAQIGVWDEVGPALKLMQGLKQRFDPRGVLNPGRFVL